MKIIISILLGFTLSAAGVAAACAGIAFLSSGLPAQAGHAGNSSAWLWLGMGVLNFSVFLGLAVSAATIGASVLLAAFSFIFKSWIRAFTAIGTCAGCAAIFMYLMECPV